MNYDEAKELAEQPLSGEYSDMQLDEIAGLMIENEDYDMLARENKNLAEALKRIGDMTDEEVSNVANGSYKNSI